MEFKDGDRVKIEGVLRKGEHHHYTLRLYDDKGDFIDSFTKDGRLYSGRRPILELIERPKKKVAFKDWREDKVYEWGDLKFIKKDGLPCNEATGGFSHFSTSWFAGKEFIEIHENK